MLRRLLVGLSTLLIAAVQACAQTPVYTITYLGNVQPIAINDKGQVVGRMDTVSPYPHAFIWENGVLTDLGALHGDSGSIARGINNAGQVVGYSWHNATDDHPRAFLWQNGVMKDIGNLGKDLETYAYGINNFSQIAGSSYFNDSSYHPFRWQLDSMLDLGSLGGSNTLGEATAINDAGQIVGYSHIGTSTDVRPFIWTEGEMVDLGLPTGAVWGYAQGINVGGVVVGTGGSDADHAHAFMWQDGKAFDLNTWPGDVQSDALGISSLNQVVGNSWSADLGYRAVIWQNGRIHDLNSIVPFGSPALGDTEAINAKGQIIVYSNPAAYLLTPTGFVVQDRAGNAGKFSLQLVYPGMQAGADTTTATLTMSGQSDITGENSVVFEDDGFKTSVLHVSFDLTNAKPGKWTLVVNSPNMQTVTLNNAFTVEEARNPEIGVQVSGRDQARAGFATTYQVVVTNTGNFDAVDVPIWIACNDPKAKISSDFPILPPPADSGPPVDWPNRFPTTVSSASQVMAPILIPRVPPGGVVILQFRVTFNDSANVDLVAWTNPLYRRLLPNIPTDPATADFIEIIRQAYKPATGSATLLDKYDQDLIAAAAATLNQFGTVLDNAYKNTLLQDSPSPLIWLVEQATFLLASKKGVSVGDGPLINAINSVFPQLGSTATNTFAPEGLVGQKVSVGDSDDPNGVRGPPPSAPSVPGNWVAGDLALGYSIHFENKTQESGKPIVYPAQAVKIVDTLDSVALDLSTLSLGPITVPAGSARPTSGISPVSRTTDGSASTGDYNADIQLNATSNRPNALTLHVRAYLDPTTATLTWLLTSTRQDGQPMTQDDGFLAPGEEGTVSFSIYSNKTSPSIVTENWAWVYFDQDKTGLETLPHWSNTIDNTKPKSAVTALSAIQPAGGSPSFTVSWSGSDTGVSTSIGSYTTYVATDNGPYVPWITTTLQSATYPGQGGHIYKFYSIATDLTGNVETKSAVPDTQTTIGFALYLLTITPDPVPGSQPVSGKVTLNAPAPVDLDVLLTNKNKAALFSNGTNTLKMHFAAGQASGSFTLNTSAVAANKSGVVNAEYNGLKKTATLIVRPVQIQSLTLAPNTVQGSQSATGTVTLECPAATGVPVIITLGTKNPAVASPAVATVTIPAGSTTGTFTVITTRVTKKATVKISAKANGATAYAPLTVTP